MSKLYIPVTQGGVTSLVAVQNQLFSTATTLPAKVGDVYGSYTSSIFGNDNIYLLRGRGYASENGTIVLQVSDDGVTWDDIYSTSTTGSTAFVINDVPSGGVMRYVYTDTSAAETATFRLSVYAVKVTL